jgi:hypothetical protein
LDGIRKILMAHRDARASLPSATSGAEREVLVREFLGQVFPSQFRFGSGAIIDAAGRTSGQLDIVVEFPFLPSFPPPGSAQRLYLADSAALVIEAKSDLSKQWFKLKRPRRRGFVSAEIGGRLKLSIRRAFRAAFPRVRREFHSWPSRTGVRRIQVN